MRGSVAGAAVRAVAVAKAMVLEVAKVTVRLVAHRPRVQVQELVTMSSDRSELLRRR